MGTSEPKPAEQGPDPDRIAEIFHQATERPETERAAFVAAQCGGDLGLQDEVLALLAADAFATQSAFSSPLRELVEDAGEEAQPLGSVGPYRLLEEIGEGGMGRVYRAEQCVPMRRTVAVKVMRRLSDSPEARARFRAEQDVLVRLQHRGIARVLDGGYSDEGWPYLVMDLVDGVPLHRWVIEQQPDLDARLTLFVGICDAVQHAHQKGVIHRDLKPSNVLVASGEDGPEPRLIDFGIARVVDAEPGEETLHTQQHVAMGTAGYMSPEQASDAASADARSDVYALGVMLYELLTGELPRGRAATGQSEQWQATPTRPSHRLASRSTRDASATAVASGISEDFDWVVLQALAIEPDRRYATVNELRSDVERARSFEPVMARAPTWTYLGSRFLRRNRKSAVTAAFGLVILVAAAIALLSLWREADRNWNDYRRLVDDKRLVDLKREASEELWPPWPQTVAAIDTWCARVDALSERRTDIESRSRELAQRLANLKSAAERDELAYQQEVLQRLLRGLDGLLAKEAKDDNRAGVLLRRAEAERVGRISLRDHAATWQQAIERIADASESPAYAGLRLPGPQSGLVPLGPDPQSGLWEFWHVESGDAPFEVRLDGKRQPVRIEEPHGMVFVLVPPGRFTMGALRVGDEHSGTAPIDPQAAPMEQFVHDLSVQPFFVSKFEMTQGQWLRLTGERPSFVASGRTTRGDTSDLSWPVEQVTWLEADRLLRRRGLLLPSEVQWEYFARAGTATVFGGVADEAGLSDYANLADDGSRAHLRIALEPDYDDGFAMPTAVGSLLPNPWGLFDCHGNVSEWCRDWQVSYLRPTDPADGLRVGIAADEPTVRVHRGGDFGALKKESRVSSRNAAPPEQRTVRIGVRPVRAIVGG